MQNYLEMFDQPLAFSRASIVARKTTYNIKTIIMPVMKKKMQKEFVIFWYASMCVIFLMQKHGRNSSTNVSLNDIFLVV